MDLRKLAHFHEVATAGSFGRASERLRTAQPALSKSVQALERSLGVTLLVRHSKGVDVTEAGAMLLRHAGDILALCRVVEAEVREQASEPAADIAVGVPPTLAPCLYGDLCAEVAAVHPRVRLALHEGVGHELWEDLHAERLDLAVIGSTVGSDRIVTDLVGHESVHLIAPGGTGLPAEIDRLEDLVGRPLVVTTRATSGRSWFEEVTRRSGIVFDVRWRVESPQVALDLVARGLGSAVMPASGVGEATGRGAVEVARVIGLRLPRVLASAKGRWAHPSVSFVRNTLRRLLVRLL